MKINILLIIALGCISVPSFSQTSTEEILHHYKHSIGIAAGFSTAYGLSYRYTPSKFGVQATFAPYYTEQTQAYSGGITFLYTLIAAKNSSLFLYEGNHYYYHSTTEYVDTTTQIYYYPDPKLANIEKRKNTDSYMNNGIGFGIEITFAKRVGFNLMAGYAFYNNFKQVNVTGETGLYYKF